MAIYKITDKELWNGRVDDDSDLSHFRFHQAIKVQDINDLTKNDNAFGIIGFSSDEGVRRNKGRLGAAQAPDEIRKFLAKLPYNLDEKIKTIDTGNVVCENGELENAQTELGEQINKLFHNNTTPVVIGGGHETLYGHYLGVREYIGADKTLGIVNIDAHFDLRDDPEPSSGTMFRQILEQDEQAGYLCLGVQEFGNTKALFQTADKYGCFYIMEDEIDTDNTCKEIDRFSNAHDYIMLTLCTDSIISSAAPGVSAPSPLGLDPRTVKKLLTYIAAKENILSFDISEVNPLVDENNKTVRLAAYFLAETMKSFNGKAK